MEQGRQYRAGCKSKVHQSTLRRKIKSAKSITARRVEGPKWVMAAFSSHQRPLVVLLAAPFSDQDIKEEVFLHWLDPMASPLRERCLHFLCVQHRGASCDPIGDHSSFFLKNQPKIDVFILEQDRTSDWYIYMAIGSILIFEEFFQFFQKVYFAFCWLLKKWKLIDK